MAREGMRFTRHYAGSTVCAPSRCVLLTGLHTGHARIRGNGPGQLKPMDVTFARLLQNHGYKTGCFGKWGIGNPPPLNDPVVHGFDEFYGYINMYHAHNYYPEWLVRNGLKERLRNKTYPDWKKKRFGAREGAGVAEVAVDYARLMQMRRSGYSRESQASVHDVLRLEHPHANNERETSARWDAECGFRLGTIQGQKLAGRGKGLRR